MASPLHRHTRTASSGISNMRRPQNTKAAAQRLAKVMAHQPADDEEEDDDLYDFDSAVPTAGIGLAGGRTRTRSPLPVRNPVELPQSVRSRAPAAERTLEQQPSSARTASSLLRPVQSKPTEPPPQSTHSSVAVAARTSHPTDAVEEAQPPSARYSAGGKSPSYFSAGGRSPSYMSAGGKSPSYLSAGGKSPSYLSAAAEQPSSAHAVRPNLRVKTVTTVPPRAPVDTTPDKSRDKRLSLDFGTFKYKEPSDQQSSSALQDELDMLQEENDSLLEKLRIAEERFEEAESRTRQLEKQIASLGEGVSLESRLLSRKEAELQKREAALKLATQTYGGSSEEIAALRTEAETARDEATAALDQLHDVENEVKSLRVVTQRMILTREEMEEVVLKRSWLARCWNLCVRFGIHAEIAEARHEYWSSFASRPVEVILAAGRKAKDGNTSVNNDLEEREKVLQDQDEVSRKANVESMLLAERGLRELTSLKVEEALAISMAQKRRPTFVKSDELKLPIEGNNYSEAFELSPDESEDVLLKRAWLTYFWRRARDHGLEPDVAEDKLQYWINQTNNKPQPNSHDAVDAERGLVELRKLGIETRLWEESRRLVDPDSTEKTLLETESQMLA